MKTVLRRLLRVFWYLLAALVITTAVLTSAARFLFPVVSGYRADVEAWVSQRVGEPVRIRSLRATWQGLDPVIRFGGVRVLDHQSGQVLLAARELRITLSLWGSIRARRPVADGVTVVATRLDLERLANGRIVLRGFENRPVRNLPLAALLHQRHAAIVQSTVSWTDVGQSGDALRFRDVNIRLSNRGDRHRLEGEALLPAALGQAVRFSAHLTGSLRRLRNWQGTVYMQGQGLRLGTWTAGREPAGLSLAGTADLSLWADVRDSRLAGLSGVTAVSGLDVAGHTHPADDPVHFSALTGRFRWQRAADGWRLDVDRLQVAADGTRWPQTAISVAAATPAADGAQRQWRARIGYGDVGLLRRLAADTDLLSSGVRRTLVQLHPVGQVRDLQLALVQSGGRIRRLGLQAAFKGLGVHRWGRYPALAGLSGTARGNLDSGVVRLASDDATLGDPHLFSTPVVADRLAGTVRWQRYGDRLRLHTDGLDLDNADLRTRSRIRLDIPDDGASPLLDMQVAFGDGDVSHVGRYLPEGIMPAPAVRWLRRSLVNGRITSGALLLHGRLAAFPFTNHDGVFQVDFNVRGGVLDYRPGWPRIDQLAAHVEFAGQSMELQAQSADVLGADLKDVRASIPDLRHPRLSVSGRATGKLGAMLGFLRASPLGQRYTGMLGQVRSTGSASVALSLDVPLHGAHRQVIAKGSVHLPGNALVFKDWHEGLTDLRGTLHFDGAQLSARDVHARFLQRPVRISVSTANPQGRPPQTRVDLTGRLALAERLRKSDQPLGKYISGATGWRLSMTVPGAERGNDRPSATLTLASDLKGVAVHLPSPLAKAAGERRDFVLRTTVSGSRASPVQVSYGGVLRARLALKRDQGRLQLQRGEVRFGTKPAQLPTAPGLRVTGDISRLSMGQWVEGANPLIGGAGTGIQNRVRDVDVQVQALDAFGQRFGSTRLRARRAGGAWLVDVHGAKIDGRIVWPAHPSPASRVVLALRHLAVAAASGNGKSAGAGMSPANIPPLQVVADRLDYGGVDLGRLQLDTVPEPSGLKVERASLVSDWLQLRAHGDWQDHDGHQSSRFQITVAGGNLGKMLSAFGYAGNIKGGQTRGDISANWRGSPMAFSLKRLEGHLHLKIGEGRILRVEPGAGRVFGLLSLQALPRRLSLDFSDLFRKGFSFDSIEGNFTFSAGDAYTSDLVVKGPSARIDIAGRTGLVARDYDQLVTVIPHIRSSLPIAGVIAGGPAVGAALLLMDKLFPGPLTELTSLANYQYTLTGSWDNPVVKRLNNTAGSTPAAGR
ncbi:MAG TPA: YhdP family protein [Gammaproteobacteria bacterium]|nr:YhdP family protein [Gammaproteobacteria bacterium]